MRAILLQNHRSAAPAASRAGSAEPSRGPRRASSTATPGHRPGSALRALVWIGVVGVLPAFLFGASTVRAQYPAELGGRAVDALSGEPLESVLVEVLEAGLHAWTNGRGEFLIRGLEPGRASVRLSRLGYVTQVQEVQLRNGERAWLSVRLVAEPVPVSALRAEVAAPRLPGSIRIPREEIERSGARTAAEVLQGYAGVLVQGYGPTAAQRASIRGSSADEVLVLLDGVPVGSALTGESDLSTLPAADIEQITVLKGGWSSRYGPGAAAGVILIETRASAAPLGLRIGGGALGEWTGEIEAKRRLGGFLGSGGAHHRAVDGAFQFRLPPELGGATTTRRNADLAEQGGFLALDGPLRGGQFRVRAGYQQLERGLPGRSFLPSPQAREAVNRARALAGWERAWGAARGWARVHALRQIARFVDPQPPVGLAFDSRTETLALGGQVGAEVKLGGLLESVSGGAELRRQRYESAEFEPGAPASRLDFGIFVAGELAPSRSPSGPRILSALRVDWDGVSGTWHLSHEVMGRLNVGRLELHLRNASSYSPPSLGDQFFKEGVAVVPNPDLGAERIPLELSIGTAVDAQAGALAVRVGVEGFVADVEDMIVWAPDFRFVWSPRNFDVKRRGLEAEAEAFWPAARLSLRGSYGLARVTYDRPGSHDTLQVVYRPQHTGALTLQWEPRAWHFASDWRFVGTRYPVPAKINALDPYWTVAIRARRTFAVGTWRLMVSLWVDRLLDNEDSLIFGFPEPGRTFRLELGLGAR